MARSQWVDVSSVDCDLAQVDSRAVSRLVLINDSIALVVARLADQPGEDALGIGGVRAACGGFR